jgi:hypothetical protein
VADLPSGLEAQQYLLDRAPIKVVARRGRKPSNPDAVQSRSSEADTQVISPVLMVLGAAFDPAESLLRCLG